jgi:diaminohydroxyphosphoribosylaminopyrimidine deaminase / 5-amino-6-(5-phosphoribosylamino)uracil reductase
MGAPLRSEGPLDEARVWALLLALAGRASAGAPLARGGVRLDASGNLEEVPPARAWFSLAPEAERGFDAREPLSPEVEQLLALYLPLCAGPASSTLVVAHLGQSIDGQIATTDGESRYVTGPENLRHIHRLRALCDAVVVGATTVECDDPQLTTRLVGGPNPTRVVVDPALRVRGERRVFRDDAAPTLVVSGVREGRAGHVEMVKVDVRAGVMAPSSILEALRARGLSRILIEGGGITVSRFLEARALQRLQITVSPLLIGRGRPGIVLPPVERLARALRPPTRRFHLGEDVLFDCDFDEGD